MVTGLEIKSVESFLAGVLRGDRPAAEAALARGRLSFGFGDELIWQIGQSGLAGLFYEKACQLELGDAMEQVELPVGAGGVGAGSGAAGGANLRQFLENEARQAALKAMQMDAKFRQLTECLAGEKIIWIKSTVLVRKLYEKIQWRVGIDFDAIVSREALASVLARLSSLGFEGNVSNPGMCHQLGVGPVGSVDDLFLIPQREYEGCHNLTLVAEGWPYIELKFNPLENGLRMKELDRFFADAERISQNPMWNGENFLAPSMVDHLIIEVTHFHKHRFVGWGWLHDIHIIAGALSASEWAEFVRRCRLEGVATSAWMSLRRVCELLGTRVPSDVMVELKTCECNLPVAVLGRVSTEFIWNANSLPMLMLNAALMGDGRRKMDILSESFFPDKEFLSKYYFGGRGLNALSQLWCLFIHWLVLILPGGVIRRTFGYCYWPSPKEPLCM